MADYSFRIFQKISDTKMFIFPQCIHLKLPFFPISILRVLLPGQNVYCFSYGETNLTGMMLSHKSGQLSWSQVWQGQALL